MIDAPLVLAVFVVVVAMPLSWYVFRRVRRMSQASPELRVLQERAIAALVLALIVTMFSLIFVNNELPTPLLDGHATQVITRGVLLALSIFSAVYWLRMRRR